MKKTLALILVALFVAMSFSGCETGPNLGFTRQEFKDLLTSKLEQDRKYFTVGEWTDSYSSREKYYLNVGKDMIIWARCANNGAGPVYFLTAMLDLINWKPIEATDQYIYLVRAIYEIVNPEHTEEQSEEFEETIMDAIYHPIKDHYTYLTQDGYQYAICPSHDNFHFSITLTQVIQQ